MVSCYPQISFEMMMIALVSFDLALDWMFVDFAFSSEILRNLSQTYLALALALAFLAFFSH